MPNLRFRNILTDAERRSFEELLLSQPLLRLEEVAESAYLMRGLFKVSDEKGVELTSFPLEIAVPRDFPKSPPYIREVGGRIPRHADWHVYPNGRFCVELSTDFYLRGPQTLREYMDGPLRSYLLAQLHFEVFKKWPRDDDRKHGSEGVAQLCQERLGTDDVALVTKMVSLIQQWRDPKRERCPCGSHRKIAKCHSDLFLKIRAWPPTGWQGFLNDVARRK